MDRKKIIYIGSILLVTVFVSVTYFSYAFFTSKNEYHGRVNMVVGTLDYKLKSSLLSNNSITLAANEKARLHIEVESLNEINSKYELYYTTTNNNIEIGYNTTNDLPTGTINAKAKKTVTVIIKNPSNTSATVTFGVQGGFTHNTLVLDTGRTSLGQEQGEYCELAVNTEYDYGYSGIGQEFNVPCSGTYKLETWGAQGGSISSTAYSGGYGGYSTGTTSLTASETLYVYIGGTGEMGTASSTDPVPGGYNGGGNGGNDYKNKIVTSGGGATHIGLENKLLSQTAINNVLIISGGGGGCVLESNVPSYGGSGGGIRGNDSRTERTDSWCQSNVSSCTPAVGGGQENNNLYGIGASTGDGAGGGAGYYGGKGKIVGGAGGSGYIANNSLNNKSMYCYDCEENGDTNTYTVSTYGTTTHSSERDTTNCPDGYSSNPISKCAKAGNGYAKITFLSESTKEEKVSMIDEVIFNSGMSENVLFATDYTSYNATGFSQPNTMYQLNLDTAVEGLSLTKNYSELTTLPYAYKEGYIFDGWYTAKSGGTKITQLSDINSFTILYAHWTQTNYVDTNNDLDLDGTSNWGDAVHSRNDLFSRNTINNIDKYVLSFDYIADNENGFDVDTYGSYNNSTYEGPQVLPEANTNNQKFIWIVYHDAESMNGVYFRIFDDRPTYSSSSNKVHITNIKLYKY